MHHNVFTDHHHAPIILASYGATAILCFNASQVPLAQPRNILLGHFISSTIGMSIQKLFSLSHGGRSNYWASGALSVAVSSVVMAITNTIHPPAGASALLPSIDEQVRSMSWWFLPVQLVSSVLIIAVALITGNVVRMYPVYWWSPGAGKIVQQKTVPVEKGEKEKKEVEGVKKDDESYVAPFVGSGNENGNGNENENENESGQGRGGPALSKTQSRFTLTGEGIDEVANAKQITISVTSIVVPENIELDEVEVDVLKSLQQKIMNLGEESTSSTSSKTKMQKVENIV
ncbi:hypothetical protein KGF57_004160 [Candida theae]|uniref:HPP transmembrane region domain-containing protein n=1 Tax=Candida theae TaxID=1198502 RepID=A0AAD5BBQ2_9ASCO|nr:uncharacterized protein KGF57_004160 [Candida theae]KAI5952155.1 hypothetical protein KGF57_004160 [Candida theae]